MNMFLRFAVCLCSVIHLSATPLFADTTLEEPYASTELIPEYPFGYYLNAPQIHQLFRQHDIHVVVEVGSWIGGGSTRHMGNLLKEKGGLLYAVDTWLGSSTQQPGQEHYQPILSQVYQQFLSNMIHWDLTHCVIPVRMDSLLASQTLQVQPDLIYIDGEHTTDAVYADLCAWYPFVEHHGILCGDDWTWASVKVAVKQFAREKGKQIIASGNFWCLSD
ncbi:MAG: class I SAM-dependent methyltransferase [Parachlamydiaceae bacterium]